MGYALKETAYGFGWLGSAGSDSFRAQFVAVTQSPQFSDAGHGNIVGW